ncbi:MAG: nucleoside-diphosphate kinase [Patescibacteria group bacterium]
MNNNSTQSHREQTFVMIKPDGVQRNLVGEIIRRFEVTGLKLVAIKMQVPEREKLSQHYSKSDQWYEEKGGKVVDNLKSNGIEPEKPAIEYGKDIVRALLDYMSAGPAILMIWEGNKAMSIVKKLVGGTEPLTSDIGTLRGDYTLDTYEKANEDGRAVRNLMHCTDPADGESEAKREIGIWFTNNEIINYRHIQEAVLYDPTISGIV